MKFRGFHLTPHLYYQERKDKNALKQTQSARFSANAITMSKSGSHSLIKSDSRTSKVMLIYDK